MQRFSNRIAIVVAALAGYIFGTWSVGTATAARTSKDPSQELLATDREFDETTSKQGVEGWCSYFASDGIMMPSGSDLVVGNPAIHEFVSKAFTTPGFSMRWEPIDAGGSGDVGYTYGVSKVVRTAANGTPQTSYGKYVSIWRRQPDRTWKVVIDIGNASPPPAPKKPQ